MKAISDFISMFIHIFTMKDFFENWITHGTGSCTCIHRNQGSLVFTLFYTTWEYTKFDSALFLFSTSLNIHFLFYSKLNISFGKHLYFYGQGIFTQLFTMKKRFSCSFFIIILKPFSPILFLNNVGSLVKTSDLIMIRVGFPRGENPSFQLRSDSKIEI